LLADVVIAEEHVELFDGHVPAGAAAGDGGVLIWPLAMGLLRAKWHLLTGESITAQQAHGLGLVTEVVEKGASLQRAMTIAGRLGAQPQDAVRHTKRALNRWLEVGLPAYDLSWAGEILTATSPEAYRRLKAKTAV
jgi:enoyl-CoA hydratase